MSFSASSGPAMTYLDGANLRINLLQRGKDCMSSVPGTNILWYDSYGQRTIHFFGDKIKIHKIWWNFKTLALLTKFWHYYSKLSIMVWGKFSLLWMTIFRTNNAAIWSHCRAPTGSRYIATIAGKSSSQNDKLNKNFQNHCCSLIFSILTYLPRLVFALFKTFFKFSQQAQRLLRGFTPDFG